jgi:MSHA biogenesis protein MshJ
MKQQLIQQWIKLSIKLDAMTLRERAMVFLAAVAAVLFLLYTFSIEPLLAKQKLLQTQIRQQQNQIAGIDTEIAVKAQGFTVDPDAPVREQLKKVREDIDGTSAGLMAVQKGLVAPDKIAPLLEHLLRGNGKLRLMSLKTLPVAGMNEAALPAPDTAAKPLVAAPPPSGAAAAPAAPKPRELLYRHGVEIVLQGSYLDMVNYMAALESLPVQLFWGKARLEAQQYPNSRLTLTLYTLSLDQKWMKL